MGERQGGCGRERNREGERRSMRGEGRGLAGVGERDGVRKSNGHRWRESISESAFEIDININDTKNDIEYIGVKETAAGK